MPVYELGFEHRSQEVRPNVAFTFQSKCYAQPYQSTHTFHCVISMSYHRLFAVVSLSNNPFYGIKKLLLSLFLHWQQICPLKVSAKYDLFLVWFSLVWCHYTKYCQAHIVQKREWCSYSFQQWHCRVTSYFILY